MASAQTTILALGASHASVCTFEGEWSDGLVLQQVIRQNLNGDPALKDAWLETLSHGLEQLALKTSLKAVTAVLLPGWAVLNKLLKVTRIEGEGQWDVIRFEAENALPNGLQAYEWTYTVLEDDGFERDVLVEAVSSTLMSGLLDVLKLHAVRPVRIDAQISAELTALRAQYGRDEGSSVLLDVGARSVSMMVWSGQQLPFIRTINFGGSLISQTLSRRVGKTFSEAERLKLEWIQVPGPSENLNVLNQCSEGFVNRLVNELQRSLALFRRQGQAANPARILLTGGASQLPGLADFLERKTGIATLFYDPFRTVSSGPELATAHAARVAYALPGPVGMALATKDSSGRLANLLPQTVSARQEFSEKKPWLLAAAVLVLLSGLVVGLKYHWQAWHLHSRLTRMQAGLAPLEALSQAVNEAHETYTTLTAGTAAKADILTQEHYWVAFLADLQGRLNQVQDVWLESVEAERSTSAEQLQRLRITGRLLDRDNPLSLVSGNSRGRVETLLGSFEDSPFIQSVDDRRFDTSRPGILRFDFSLVVHSNMPL